MIRIIKILDRPTTAIIHSKFILWLIFWISAPIHIISGMKKKTLRFPKGLFELLLIYQILVPLSQWKWMNFKAHRIEDECLSKAVRIVESDGLFKDE